MLYFVGLNLGISVVGSRGMFCFLNVPRTVFQFLIIVYVYQSRQQSCACVCIINKCYINRISCFCVKVFWLWFPPFQFIISVYTGYY